MVNWKEGNVFATGNWFHLFSDSPTISAPLSINFNLNWIWLECMCFYPFREMMLYVQLFHIRLSICLSLQHSKCSPSICFVLIYFCCCFFSLKGSICFCCFSFYYSFSLFTVFIPSLDLLMCTCISSKASPFALILVTRVSKMATFLRVLSKVEMCLWVWIDGNLF